MHFHIRYTMNAEDIFRCSISCEIMLMVKARIRLIFSRYNTILIVHHNMAQLVRFCIYCTAIE